jgi:hypothetical protein
MSFRQRVVQPQPDAALDGWIPISVSVGTETEIIRVLYAPWGCLDLPARGRFVGIQARAGRLAV